MIFKKSHKDTQYGHKHILKISEIDLHEWAHDNKISSWLLSTFGSENYSMWDNIENQLTIDFKFEADREKFCKRWLK